MLDKIKALSKETLIYGTNTIIGRFIGFILVPFYTNKFAPDEYGIIAIIYAYIAILNVFFSIGLESGYMKFASTLEVGTKKENFSNPYLLTLLNSLFLSAILFFFSTDLTYIFQIDSRFSDLIKYTALILLFDAIVLIPFAYLRLNHKAKSFAFIKITNIVISVVLNVVLILYYKMGIEAVFISNLISSFITFLMLLPVIIKNISFQFNKQLVTAILLFSIPVIPAGIASNIVQTIGRPILKYLTNDSVVGIYQANYRLGIIMMLIAGMFEFAWRPFFLNNAKEPNAKDIFAKVLTLFTIFASFIFLVSAIFIDDIVKLNLPFNVHLIGKAYWEGLSIVPIILFSYLLYGIYINFMAGIYIEKKTKYLPLITGLGAVTNIAANFLLIPLYSYTGAAAATLLSYLVMMIGIHYYSQKFYKINYEYKKIGLVLSSVILLTLAYFYINYSFPLDWYYQLIFPLIFIVLVFLFKVVDLSQLSKLRAK